MIGKPRVDFGGDDFDVLVFQKGLDITWESSILCPCKLDGRGNIPTCINCSGSGYVFINPVKTKMVVQSMNLTTKNTSWSLEKVGMVSITTRHSDNVGDMDRITLDKTVSKMSQILRPKFFKNKLFAFTNYPVVEIIDVFMFNDDHQKLTRLSNKQYSKDGNKIIFDKSLFSEDMSVSVRYKHPIQYFIVDIPREIRESLGLMVGKDDKSIKLPVSAIGRRCHHVLRSDKFEQGEIIDNSYQ